MAWHGLPKLTIAATVHRLQPAGMAVCMLGNEVDESRIVSDNCVSADADSGAAVWGSLGAQAQECHVWMQLEGLFTGAHTHALSHAMYRTASLLGQSTSNQGHHMACHSDTALQAPTHF